MFGVAKIPLTKTPWVKNKSVNTKKNRALQKGNLFVGNPLILILDGRKLIGFTYDNLVQPMRK